MSSPDNRKQQAAVIRAAKALSNRQQETLRREPNHSTRTDVKLDKALTIGVISGLTVEQFNALK
jgi:hypothetical protein